MTNGGGGGGGGGGMRGVRREVTSLAGMEGGQDLPLPFRLSTYPS